MEFPGHDLFGFLSLFLGILFVVVIVGEYRRRRKGRAYREARAGNYTVAIRHFDELIAASRRNAAAYAGRGACYLGLNQLQQGIDDCSHAVGLGLSVHENFGNLGAAFFRRQEFANAITNWSKAIELWPQDAEYHRFRGYAYLELHSIAEAAADFSQVIRLTKDDANAYLCRGHAYCQSRDFPRAIVDFTAAIALCPELADAYLLRGDANYRIADYSAAMADCAEALRLKPDEARVWNLMAWIQATCPDSRFRDGAKAVERAERACQLAQPREWYFVGTLAAAYAEAGRFEEAVRFAREVLTFAPAEELRECEESLAGFERGKPYRDNPFIPKRNPHQ